jgi:peptide alpha-N-acetyltransferase
MVAHHLNGDIAEALEAYDGLEGCMKSDGATPVEQSQVCLYVVKLCVEGKRYEEGLKRLEEGLAEKVISPRGEASQLKGEPGYHFVLAPT